MPATVEPSLFGAQQTFRQANGLEHPVQHAAEFLGFSWRPNRPLPNRLFKGTSTRYAVCRPLTPALGFLQYSLQPTKHGSVARSQNQTLTSVTCVNHALMNEVSLDLLILQIFRKLDSSMRMTVRLLAATLASFLVSCASPPSSDPSTVDAACAQQCSGNLATCSSGFKLFPIVQQKQCNDTYDVCIKGCPARTKETSSASATPQSTGDRLKRLDELYKAGAITKEEYEAKRKDIIGSL
jgi:hypothetical protein